jgi:hypothetical protein
MDEKRYDALEQALTQLESGSELEDIQSAYPDLTAELETAVMAKSISQEEIPPGAASRSRTRILARADQLRRDIQPRRLLFNRVPRFTISFIIIAVLLLSSGGLVVASAQAIPGDQLYGVKRTLETVRLGLAVNPQSHQHIEELYQSRRVDEVQRLLELGRPEMVEFYGVVEEQTDVYWMISGIEVKLGPETVLIGDILPGMTVEVEGATQPEGIVLASEIHLQTFAFIGIVESISSGIWQIDGRQVNITTESLVDPSIQVGDWVMVTVQSDDFGNLTARSIELSGLATPTAPIPTSTPTRTLIPSPTFDDETGDEMDDENETPEPEEPDETDESDETDETDETDEIEETDEPDETDEPEESDENEESEEDEPDETDEP